KREQVSPRFVEDGIAKLSPSGKILLTRSLPRILKDNGLAHLFEGYPYNDDPFHLNDIEPVPGSGPNWARGDVFLSIRNLSLVALYRPSTGRILWWRQGPWLSQHDVTILDDHRIGIIDNHAVSGYPRNY